MVALGLLCYWRAFSSCHQQRLLSSYSAGASHCSALSCCRYRALGAWVSGVVAQGLSYSMACGIFPEQRWNSCLLYWQVDSHSLHHQGSPTHFLNLFDQRIFFFFHATSINIPWNMCYGNPGVHPYRGFSRQALLNFGSPLPLCSW